MLSEETQAEESREFFGNLLSEYGVLGCLTPDEAALFSGNPDRQDVLDTTWRYEAYWVLLWSLPMSVTVMQRFMQSRTAVRKAVS